MTEDIIFERRGRIGLVTLNRPQALNALNRGMCIAMLAQLDDWADDPEVHGVVVQGAGDRAFCAGGDVVGLHAAGRSGSPEWEGFFFDEYRMNHRIGTYAKPYVALLDGIFMGGGVGLSVHAPFRVTTERTVFAMPETGIGLIPDVGGTHALPRLPGELGTYLGLTGARLKAADCAYAGIATHHVESQKLGLLVTELAEGVDDFEDILATFSGSPGDAPLKRLRDAIDMHFGQDNVEEIVELLASGDDWAQAQSALIRAMSPTSCKLTLRLLREGAGDSLAACLRREYRVVCAIKHGHDFFEGVRAQLIDKDRNPHWRPATLESLSAEDVDTYFQEPVGGDLVLDG